MGSETRMNTNPRFVVKAAGSFKQKPGCPEYSFNALGSEEVERLCRNECYNPSDVRNKITRIEVARITPQIYEGEPIKNLIRDNDLQQNVLRIFTSGDVNLFKKNLQMMGINNEVSFLTT